MLWLELMRPGRLKDCALRKKCQHRVLTVMQASAGTTAFTQSASYGRLWDDIHLSGHFTCRLPTICEFLPSSSRGQNIFLLDANSISQLVDVVNQWMTGSLISSDHHARLSTIWIFPWFCSPILVPIYEEELAFFGCTLASLEHNQVGQWRVS